MVSAKNLAHSRAGCRGQSQHRPGTPKQQNRAWPIDFRHPDDTKSRKDNHRCVLKARIFNVWRFIGSRATARQIAQLLHMPLRTTEWGIALLKQQGFVANVRKVGLNGPMQVEFRILRSSTVESCGVTSSRKRQTEKEKEDTYDTTQKTAASSFATPAIKVQKPFRTPRQVFQVARGLVGSEYAMWTYYRALKAGREAGTSLAMCVPKSITYYVKAYRNFCLQFEPSQHQGILENAADRMKAEQDLWMDRHEDFGALDRIPRHWKESPPQKKRAKRTKNPCGQEHNYYSPCAACDAVTFGGGA